MRGPLALVVVGGAAAGALWLARRQAAAPPGPAVPAAPAPVVDWSAPIDVAPIVTSVENVVNKLTLPRGLRNNNPGNLRPGSQWQGLDNPADDGQGYLRFVSPHYGLRAAAVNLKNQQLKHKLRTVRAIITKYAPASDNNNTGAYINAVSKRLGVSPDATLDLTRPATLQLFLRAVVTHENGRGDYYDDGTYARAIEAAL